MHKIIAICLIIAGIIHLLPITGAIGAQRLTALYGLSFQEPNISILMRHRAILFGLLGLFLIYAAFKPILQPIAFIAGLISAVSFIAIAWSVGDYNNAIGKIVLADIIAIVSLLLAAVLYFIAHQHGK